MTTESITPREFMEFETNNSRAAPHEWVDAVDPKFTRCRIMLKAFLSIDIFPTCRRDRSGIRLTSVFEDRDASPISFLALAGRPDLT